MRDDAKTIEILRSCSNYSTCGNCPIGGAEFSFEDCRNVFRDAADAIEELLAAVPKWISVEERLPSRYETVLLYIRTYKDSYITIGDYEPNELRFRDFGDRNNQVYCGDIVTHWASLPEAPREEI